MKKLKIYLDTSVINFLFHEDVPELREVTETFFENHVGRGECEVYVSAAVVTEIEETPDQAKRALLMKVIDDYRLTVLPLTDEANRLAMAYIEGGAIPRSKVEDAQHVAVATCNQIDILLSWNFKHLANMRRQIAVRVINEREGYFYPLALTTPMEALDEND